jgi:hypothetical protein
MEARNLLIELASKIDWIHHSKEQVLEDLLMNVSNFANEMTCGALALYLKRISSVVCFDAPSIEFQADNIVAKYWDAMKEQCGASRTYTPASAIDFIRKSDRMDSNMTLSAAKRTISSNLAALPQDRDVREQALISWGAVKTPHFDPYGYGLGFRWIAGSITVADSQTGGVDTLWAKLEDWTWV